MSARGVALWLAAACLLLPAVAGAATGGGDDASAGRTLFFNVLNFALLVGVLVAVGRKPMRAFFEDRRSEIRQELDGAAEVLARAEARHAELQQKLVNLDAELGEIRQTAVERAEAERERILRDAQATAERIRNDASAAMAQEVVRARESLRRDAAELAVEIATERLRGTVNEADRERLVDEFIERVESPVQPGAGQ